MEGPTVTLPQPEELCYPDEDTEETTMTSSGRVVRKPLRFKDYVLELRSLSKYLTLAVFEQLHEFASCCCCMTQ